MEMKTRYSMIDFASVKIITFRLNLNKTSITSRIIEESFQTKEFIIWNVITQSIKCNIPGILSNTNTSYLNRLWDATLHWISKWDFTCFYWNTKSLKGKWAPNNQCLILLLFQTIVSRNVLALNASSYTNLNKLMKTLFYFPAFAYKP